MGSKAEGIMRKFDQDTPSTSSKLRVWVVEILLLLFGASFMATLTTSFDVPGWLSFIIGLIALGIIGTNIEIKK